jgi:pantoate--beta-alanine ligase
VLVRSLRAAAAAVVSGERDARTVRAILVETLASEPAVRIDYAEVVDASTLQGVDQIEHDTLIALAAFVGNTRLIDNIAISVVGDTTVVDQGLLATVHAEVD